MLVIILYILMITLKLLNCSFLNWNISYKSNKTKIIAATTPIHFDNNTIWICGGYFSNFCYLIQIDLSSFQIVEKQEIYLSTPLRSYKQKSRSFHSKSTNQPGINGDRVCFVGLNIGTTDSLSMCCTITHNNNNNKINCDEIYHNHDRFQSCVIYDKFDKNLIQIGGLNGNKIYDDINCFDLDTEHYKQCKFSYFKLDSSYGGNWMSGCTMTDQSTFVIVGGDYENEAYSNKIQICRGGEPFNGCFISHRSYLDQGVLYPKVIRLTNCKIIIMGGQIKTGGKSNKVYIYNVCLDIIEDTDTLPIKNGISLFNVYIKNYNNDTYLCVFGGSTNDNQLYEKFVNDIYCSLLGINYDNNWREHSIMDFITSQQPTMYPTSQSPTITTLNPTISTSIINMNEWYNINYKYNTARSHQICATQDDNDENDDESAFFFGGIEWSLNGNKYLKESTEFVSLSKNLTINKYKVYEYNKNYEYMPMSTVSCSRQCSAIYKNNLYIVMPNNKAVFYHCFIDKNKNELKCRDLCDGNGLNNAQCKYLTYDSCVTSSRNDEYLYIIGGSIGSLYKSSISIFNMKTNKWTNNMFNGKLKLSIGLIAASCAIYNNSLFIFGGLSISNSVLDNIYQCKLSKSSNGCNEINTKLQKPRYMHQSRVVGRNIIISCGDNVDNYPISSIEIFDAINYEIQYGPSLNNPRRYCCMIDFNSSLLISGGDVMQTNGLIVGTNTIIQNHYHLMQYHEKSDDNDNDNDMDIIIEKIINCKQYYVKSDDGTFNIIFYFGGILSDGYYIWMDDENLSLQNSVYIIVFKKGKECWIGGNGNWAYNSIEPYLIIGTSNKWIITYPDYTTKYVNIDIKCVDNNKFEQYESSINDYQNNNYDYYIQSNNDKNDNDDFKFGFTKSIFIVICVSMSIILILIIIICIICFIRNKNIQNMKRRNNALNKRQDEDQDELSTNHRKQVITPNILFSDPTSPSFKKDIVYDNQIYDDNESECQHVNNLSD